MTERNLLGEIFATPEHEVRSFMDTIRDSIGREKKDEVLAQTFSGDAEKIVAARTIEQTSGAIRIERVWHGDDCAWHIAPAHRKKPWKVGEDRVIFAIIRVMNEVIPNSVRVDISLPYHDPDGDWDIKEITFKARGILAVWNVSAKDLDKMTEKLFVVLNKLV